MKEVGSKIEQLRKMRKVLLGKSDDLILLKILGSIYSVKTNPNKIRKLKYVFNTIMTNPQPAPICIVGANL